MNNLKMNQIITIHIPIIMFIVVISGSLGVSVAKADQIQAVVNETLDAFEEKLEFAVDNQQQSQKRVIDQLFVTDGQIKEVLDIVSRKADVIIEYEDTLNKEINVYLTNVDLEDALKIILNDHDLTFTKRPDIDGEFIYEVILKKDLPKKEGIATADNTEGRSFLLKHAKVLDIAGILEETRSEHGKFIINEKFNALAVIDSLDKLKEMTGIVGKLDVALQTEIFELEDIKFEKVDQQIKNLVTQNVGEYQFDVRSNAVIVTDTEEKISKIREFLDELEEKVKEVVLEVKILQILLSDEHIDGVDWEAIVSDFRKLALSKKQKKQNNHLNPFSVGSLNREDFEVLQEALDTIGVVSTISNEQRTLEDSDVEVHLDYEELFKSFEIEKLKRPLDKKDELAFYISTSVIEEDGVKMTVEPFVGQRVVNEKLVLTNETQQNKMQETLNLPKESTLIIGGYFIDKVIESPWKIPLLGDIPFLGFVFRSEGQVKRKTEVIVFVTPKLVDTQDVEIE